VLDHALEEGLELQQGSRGSAAQGATSSCISMSVMKQLWPGTMHSQLPKCAQ
jgi:hypothetical protein